MSESENKNVVLRFFENLSAGDIDAALALMDNDAVYWVSGKPKQFPLAGTYTKRQLAPMLDTVGRAMPNGITASITATTAESDRVAVEAKVSGVSGTCKVYENKLFYAFEVRNGKIHSGREYLDTMHANEVLAQR
jgi:ketosteroid isomerase-like protein